MQTYTFVVAILAAVCDKLVTASRTPALAPRACFVWGPGLSPHFNVPVRYFYVQLVNKAGVNVTESAGEGSVTATVAPVSGDWIRVWTEVLDWHDGSYVVRYRLYASTSDLQINVFLNGEPVGKSPYYLTGKMYPDSCNCPHQTSNQWAASIGCPATYPQIELDLQPFHQIDMEQVAHEAVHRFGPRGHCFCHYKLINNKVYRKCYGEHVGFNMFSDAILLSLTRKMQLPDIEFLINLGDWPLEGRLLKDKPIPIISWCGSKETHDIILPTYDLTEATLQMLGRVSLDVFSVQANTGPKWHNKSETAFWRGRDSRQERLSLVEMSHQHPELINARLTFMFFFPKNESKYGELAEHMSFYDFFKYKYQLNIDGTVAAYRFPYLLAGDAVVFKQDSGYYEHFYSELEPGVHYVPFKRDLSDLLDKISWAKQHDQQVRQIGKNGQAYVRERLTPAHILCYHVRLFEQYAKLLKQNPQGIEGFDFVDQPQDDVPCSCSSQQIEEEHTHGEEL